MEAQRVKSVLEEYMETYRIYSSRKDKDEFRLFVEGVASKIAACLEEPYKLELQWLA